MALGVYLNFKTEAKEVVKFYENVFGVVCNDLMTFGDMPEDENFQVPAEIKDLVMNCSLLIHETTVMLSDSPEGMGTPLNPGNNVSLIVVSKDAAEIEEEFLLLSEGGQVIMPLGKTFWSDKYGFVVDKYGIGWSFNLEN